MKIAIFGGTFDPIHNAHLAVARAARDQFELDQVLLVPAALPPHKLHLARESYEHRYRMVELACVGERGLVASRLEEGVERSYSVLTIQRVREALHEPAGLFFLIGADAFAEITTWYRWEDVLRMVEFIVAGRRGHSYGIPEGAIVHTLHTVDLPISSSAVRRKIAAGLPVPEIPEAGYLYICAEGLYGSP